MHRTDHVQDGKGEERLDEHVDAADHGPLGGSASEDGARGCGERGIQGRVTVGIQDARTIAFEHQSLLADVLARQNRDQRRGLVSRHRRGQRAKDLRARIDSFEPDVYRPAAAETHTEGLVVRDPERDEPRLAAIQHAPRFLDQRRLHAAAGQRARDLPPRAHRHGGAGAARRFALDLDDGRERDGLAALHPALHAREDVVHAG